MTTTPPTAEKDMKRDYGISVHGMDEEERADRKVTIPLKSNAGAAFKSLLFEELALASET